MHPDKGIAEAIAVAGRTGLPLVLAGIIADQAYFEAEVAPHLGDRVRYVGSVGPRGRSALLGGALALIHLINFDEPFGLSVVEAMATGTPVITRPRGAMPEVVRHGETGIFVEDVDGAVSAVAQVDELDRRRCRADVEERFSADRMVDDYVALYERILRRPPW